MSDWLGGVLFGFVKRLLQWFLEGALAMYQDYMSRQEDEKRNQEIKDGVDKAQTDEELQKALRDAALKLGRHP